MNWLKLFFTLLGTIMMISFPVAYFTYNGVNKLANMIAMGFVAIVGLIIIYFRKFLASKNDQDINNPAK